VSRTLQLVRRATLLSRCWVVICSPCKMKSRYVPVPCLRFKLKRDCAAGSPLLLLAMRTITFVFALAVVVSQIVRVGVISFKFYTVWYDSNCDI